jgi:thymidylate synthase (FAD)
MTYDLSVSGPFHNFVANGFIVHNSLNEYSGRYSEMPTEFYVPTPDRLAVQSKTNKQGSGTTLSDEDAATVLDLLRTDAEKTFANYQTLLKDFDLARELARLNLPLSTYTKIYWKMDLRNLLGFLILRMDSHAQWETRQFANVIGGIVKLGFPNVWEAHEDYHTNAITFTAPELRYLTELANHANSKKAMEDSGLSKRELTELKAKIQRMPDGRPRWFLEKGL